MAREESTNLDDICPDYLLVSRLPPALLLGRADAPSAEEMVLGLLLGEDDGHAKALHVRLIERSDLRHVLLLHLAQAVPLQPRAIGHLVEADHAGQCLVLRDVREAHVDELGHVQAAVVVLAHGHRRGEERAGGVQGLEDALQVALPGHLLDEHRGETLRAQLLVHTQEVDLAHVDDAARN